MVVKHRKEDPHWMSCATDIVIRCLPVCADILLCFAEAVMCAETRCETRIKNRSGSSSWVQSEIDMKVTMAEHDGHRLVGILSQVKAMKWLGFLERNEEMMTRMHVRVKRGGKWAPVTASIGEFQ